MVESEHPYPFDARVVEKVEIEGASYMILSFTKESSLGKRRGAKLTVFTDESLTEELGKVEPDELFPGNGGRKPLMIRGSKAFIVLVSPPAPDEGPTAPADQEWGFVAVARAEVKTERAVLLKEQLLQTEGLRVETDACVEALRLKANDMEDARALLVQNPFLQSAATPKPLLGCFEHEDGQVIINLQTFEALVDASALGDLDSSLWASWRRLLVGAAPVGPTGFMAPPSSVVAETWLHREHRIIGARKSESHTCFIKHWLKPLDPAPTRGGFLAARSSSAASKLCDDDGEAADRVKDSAEILREMCSDFGLHGLEKLKARNHPCLLSTGKLAYLGLEYEAAESIFDPRVPKAFLEAVSDLLDFFPDRDEPKLWFQPSGFTCVLHDRPLALFWFVPTTFGIFNIHPYPPS